jgi:hypothetical protein
MFVADDRGGGGFAGASDDHYLLCTAPPWRPSVGGTHMVTLLWIIAVVLVIAGIVSIFRGQMLWGIVLIVVGLLVGPGGVSIFH